MASALYLENFLESIENLPQELQRNFTLMRSLDQRTEGIKAEIEESSREYTANVAHLSKEERTRSLNKIQEMFKKATENSDNKVQIAMQMYEMVDKHIRRLDSDLSRFEQELQMKDVSGRRTSTASLSDLQTPTMLKAGRKRAGGPSGYSSGSEKKKHHLSISDEPGPSGLLSPIPLSMGAKQPTDVLDMPVDPNEPTYCFCHQVSYGEMIGCDNQDCPIEWFHFQCVGLSSKPKGKWFCPNCSQDRDKLKKNSKY